MKNLFLFIMTMSILSFVACQNDSKPTNTETKSTTTSTDSASKDCTYGVQADGVKVNWTAYKTTKRVGVKGTFNDVQINTASNTPDISTLVRATSFKVNSKTVNSNNEERDAKLVEFFFSRMAGNLAITGSVKSVDGNNELGTGVLSVSMNGMAKDAPFTYKVEGKQLTLKSVINTDKWDAQPAMASLHKACEEKHTGEDGVSKTWPDVAVEVVVPLVVTCK